MNIDNLSLEEKIGQRFIFGVNNYNVDSIFELIKKNHIGGVVLYKKNYHSYQELLAVVKKLKLANKDNKIPLFIAIDQEGGKVNRLPSEIHNLKNIYDVSKCDSGLIFDYSKIISTILKETGINMNFSPVMDVYNNSKSKALYKRCFYGDVENVTKYGLDYLNGTNKNVISVIKHYPGHGATKKDSHFLIPYVYDYQEILNKHIVPFDKLIENGIDAIMVGHLVIRKITKLLPASISNKFIDNYLRNNYNGLIITDEINMIKRWPFYHFMYLNKALKSHSDILLIKIKNSDEGYKIIKSYKKILNEISNKQLDDTVMRVLEIKKKYNVSDSIPHDEIDINKINSMIDKINDKII